MKHPNHEVLQDYFENILNPVQEALVKEHLLNCDQCTGMLAQFTVIERKLKKGQLVTVSNTTKNKIFKDATALLQVKKDQVLSHQAIQIRNVERLRKLEQFMKDSKESIFAEIKIPILQACSISLVLLTVIAIEKINTKEVTFKPINTQVEETTGDK